MHHVLIKESGITHTSVSVCKVSPAGWDKNLEKDVKMLMSLSESHLYVGQEHSFLCSEENGMGFIEQSPS